MIFLFRPLGPYSQGTVLKSLTLSTWLAKTDNVAVFKANFWIEENSFWRRGSLGTCNIHIYLFRENHINDILIKWQHTCRDFLDLLFPKPLWIAAHTIKQEWMLGCRPFYHRKCWLTTEKTYYGREIGGALLKVGPLTPLLSRFGHKQLFQRSWFHMHCQKLKYIILNHNTNLPISDKKWRSWPVKLDETITFKFPRVDRAARSFFLRYRLPTCDIRAGFADGHTLRIKRLTFYFFKH